MNMFKHLCKLVWNRKRINFLITLEIFVSYLVVFAVMVLSVYYIDNYRQPLGFKYDNVWTIEASMPPRGPGENANSDGMATSRRLLESLREFNEIEIAAGAWQGPYTGGDWSSSRKLKDGTEFDYGVNQVTDEFKDVMSLNLVRGRWFSKEDDGGTAYKPVVINQRMARAFFGDEDPIGKDVSNPEEKEHKEERVIGVIDDFRKNSEFSDVRGYLFHRQDFKDEKAFPPEHLMIRVRPDTTAEFEEKLIARLQAEAKGWSFKVKPLAVMRDERLTEYLVPITAAALVAGFLLIMVALGLTGVLWQNVTQRIKEIGLRRAKGATARKIYKQIFTELMIVTTAALIIGVLVVVQFPLLNLLGFVTPKVYAASIVLSLALIYLLTIVCGLYPSRLATTVQPAEALHYE
jgi:putative ABC transport system permease protein